MKDFKVIVFAIISFAILSIHPFYHGPFAKEPNKSIRITAICDNSKLTNTQNNVYVLNLTEYRQYIDDKISLDKLKISGKAPLVLSSLSSGEYYIGVEIIFDTDVIKPELVSMNPYLVTPLPEKYYINDMNDGWGRGMHLSFGQDGKANYNFYFVKWYQVTIADKIEHVVALFLNKTGQLSTWDKYYPKDHKYKIIYDSEALNKILEQLPALGIKTTIEEKGKIIELLKRGGKVYFPRNGKPNIFALNSEGKIGQVGSLDIEEALEMKEIFVSTNPIPAISTISPPSKSITPPTTIAPNIENKFPKFSHGLSGSNEIRVYNPNTYTAYIAIRADDYGSNFHVSPKSTSSIFVPNNKYDIYFIYSDKPEALFQGDSFTLNNNGVGIKLVKVAGGNYGIRRVK